MRVAIAIGSNINPEQNMQQCFELLKVMWPDIQFSPLYRTAAQLEQQQDDFLNACAVFESNMPIELIAEELIKIEQTLKKNPPYKYGPRTIDLDILLYGDEAISFEIADARFQIPHERIAERRFVLEPLCNLLDPDEVHPAFKKSWKELLEKVSDQECKRIELD